MAKKKPGRPVTMPPEGACETVLGMMAEGASKTQVCAALNTGWDTFALWQERDPMFLEAVKKGTLLSQAWWEAHGSKQLENKEFNHVLWYMNMKNRFGWADKQETKHSGEMTIKIDRDGAKVL